MTDQVAINHLCFESYGVRIRLESNSPEIAESAFATASRALLDRIRPVDCEIAEQIFSFFLKDNGDCEVIQNGQFMTVGVPGKIFWKYFDSLVRILVAEFTRDRLFLHAGVVGWKKKGHYSAWQQLFWENDLRCRTRQTRSGVLFR